MFKSFFKKETTPQSSEETLRVPENIDKNFEVAYALFRESCEECTEIELGDLVGPQKQSQFISGKFRDSKNQVAEARLYPPEMTEKERATNGAMFEDMAQPKLTLNSGPKEALEELGNKFKQRGVVVITKWRGHA